MSRARAALGVLRASSAIPPASLHLHRPSSAAKAWLNARCIMTAFTAASTLVFVLIVLTAITHHDQESEMLHPLRHRAHDEVVANHFDIEPHARVSHALTQAPLVRKPVGPTQSSAYRLRVIQRPNVISTTVPAVIATVPPLVAVTTHSPLISTSSIVTSIATSAPLMHLPATAMPLPQNFEPLFPSMIESPFSPPQEKETPTQVPLKTPADSMSKEALAAGYHPIGLVAFNRPQLLERTLHSLLQLDGIEHCTVTIYQDSHHQTGHHSGISDLAKRYKGVKLVQRPHTAAGAGDGAARIAAHYKFTLSHIFDSNPTAQYGIIVEDDMIFSPDFLAFFQHTYKLYERDPTVYCISSWNDNGRFGLVKDANRLLRTEFFIGLGWLASRKQYKSEFEKIWPPTHWDHWMRDPAQRKNRVCVYPELPRNYNIGKIGTHSDHSLFQRYFADIHHNLLPPNKLKYTSIDAMLKESYDAEVGTLIYQATQVPTMHDLTKLVAQKKPQIFALFYQAFAPQDSIWESKIAPAFGLWHSIPFIRGNVDGVQRLWYKGHYLLLIASYSPYDKQYRKKDGLLFSFEKPERTDVDPGVTLFKADINESCHSVCVKHSKTCSHTHLPEINSCALLKKAFGCTSCAVNRGQDQPVMTKDGVCLKNGGSEFSCAASHHETMRLCPCV